MNLLSIRNFKLEQTETGSFAVYRYETESLAFEHLGERDDLKDAVLLLLDELRAQIELDEFVEISPPVCLAKQHYFTEKRRKRLKAKVTLSVRPDEC